MGPIRAPFLRVNGRNEKSHPMGGCLFFGFVVGFCGTGTPACDSTWSTAALGCVRLVFRFYGYLALFLPITAIPGSPGPKAEFAKAQSLIRRALNYQGHGRWERYEGPQTVLALLSSFLTICPLIFLTRSIHISDNMGE